MTSPVLMLGAGRMGGAMIEGWRKAGVFAGPELMICDPKPGPTALAAAEAGARLNPPQAELAQARTVVLAVKPQVWTAIASEYAARLSTEAVIVSIAAGVRSADLSREFGGRAVARVMPTTAAAIGQGAASVYAEDAAARARAHELFEPLGVVADFADEELMHAATAVSGSGPAYLYAFIEALEGAGVTAGLSPQVAAKLARATVTGAAALLAQGGGEPAELRRQVTSPGGTTEAALNVLLSDTGLPPLMREAVTAAIRRSKALGA